MTQTLTKEVAADTIGERAISICVLDDDPAMIELLRDMLAGFGFGSKGTTDPHEAIEAVRAGGYRVVISDMKMPVMNGRAFLDAVLKVDPGAQVILISGFYSLDAAVEAIKHGAYDYLSKPIDRVRLRKTLDEINDLFGQRKRIRELESRLLEDLNFHGIIGKSPAMYEVFDLARKVAKHYTNVLVTGQTGTGKELVAHAIHKMSPVSQQKFAVCNCSALIDTLLESQLFGHIRGAFTGATDTRPGLFEYANGGTVFLDEVGEMSLGMQAKLLRVIQNREIQRVGSPEVRRVDVRLVAATNRDLRAEVQAGRFREDLYYRLSTVQIRVPSLAERLEDVPLLIHAFLKRYSASYHKDIQGLTRRAQTVLLQYGWPGNVRELENVISGACIRATGEFIDLDDFPEHLQRPIGRAGVGDQAWRALPLEEVKRAHIERVLAQCKDNRVKAAQILGIGRTSLYRHLKRTEKLRTKMAGLSGN